MVADAKQRAVPPEPRPAGALPGYARSADVQPADVPPAGTCGRREMRRAERRAAIVEVAWRSFLDEGYAATTMSAIAARLGGSKATLWSYFPSKELLFAAVVERAAATFHADLARGVRAGVAIETALTDYVRQFLNNVSVPDNLAFFRMIVAEAGRFPALGRMFLDSAAGRTRDLLAARLAAAMAAGALRADDPQRAAEQLLGLSQAGCYKLMLFGQMRFDPADPAGAALLDADARAAVAVFMRAYAPDSA